MALAEHPLCSETPKDVFCRAPSQDKEKKERRVQGYGTSYRSSFHIVDKLIKGEISSALILNLGVQAHACSPSEAFQATPSSQ